MISSIESSLSLSLSSNEMRRAAGGSVDSASSIESRNERGFLRGSPVRKKQTGQGTSDLGSWQLDSALLRPVSRGPHEHGCRGRDMGVPSHGRRDEGRHSWCSGRPHSGEHQARAETRV